jgi:hypothetical protein
MPDTNALDPTTPMGDPVAQWLALQRVKNSAEGIGDDNLLNRVFAQGDAYYAPPPPPAGVRPIWSPDNPVGTSRLRDTYAGPASPSFSPLVTRPYADVPVTAAKAAEIETGARDYSTGLFGDLSMMELPGFGRAVTREPVVLAQKRVRAPGSDRPPEPGARAPRRSASLDGHLPFPDAEAPAPAPSAEPVPAPTAPAPSAVSATTPAPAAEGPVSHSLDGHVPFPDAAAPTPSSGVPATAPLTPRPAGAPVMESLASRLGSNADADLAALGLPAYGDIVPSTRTGPVSQAQLRAGSPAHPDNVLDLANTWQVPNVPQTDLARIDPYGGKRKGLPEHIINAMSNPDLEAKLRFVAEKGLEVGGAHWYNAEPLRQAFVDRLGPEEGNAQFDRYMAIVGATSAGSEVSQNIRAASYYHVMERAGTPVRTSNDLISPYGHKMQQAHVSGYRGLDEGDTGTLNPETQPKRSSFVANLGGNQQPVTGDKHFIRLIGMLSQDPAFLNGKTVADVNYPALGIAKGESRNWKEEVQFGRITMEQALQHPHMWQDMPDPNHYGALEAWAQHIASKMGLTPAQLQAALWVGGGRVTGLRSLPKSFLGIFEHKLYSTADRRGITKEQALDDFIRGRNPLLSPLLATGAAGAAAAAAQNQNSP